MQRSQTQQTVIRKSNDTPFAWQSRTIGVICNLRHRLGSCVNIRKWACDRVERPCDLKQARSSTCQWAAADGYWMSHPYGSVFQKRLSADKFKWEVTVWSTLNQAGFVEIAISSGCGAAVMWRRQKSNVRGNQRRHSREQCQRETLSKQNRPPKRRQRSR